MTSMLKIRQIEEKDKDLWNDFASSQKNAQVLQSFEWGKVKTAWKAFYLMVFEENNPLAAALILKRKLPYINKSIFYSPRGPLVNFHDTRILFFLMDQIEDLAKKEKAILYKIDPFVKEDDHRILEQLIKFKFKPIKEQIQPRTTYILDLTLEAEKILMNCEEKTRYNIRLAQKKGVIVKEMASLEGIDVFYELYKETSQRDNFMIHPKEYYIRIFDEIISKGLGGVFIAYFEEKPIAGVIAFNFGDTAWYMYGASLSSFRNVMPNHILHWQIIQWAKERNCKQYDFWGIPSDPQPDHPLFGVYRFKKGFRGQLVKLIGAYDLVFDQFWYNFFEKGLKAFKNLRSLIKKGKISDSLQE